MIRLLAFVTTVLAASAAWAQSHQPYAGMRERPIKALSQDQIADLNAGRGMGLALPAELNGYPGPVHVLEHADALQLTPHQRERTLALYEAMKAEAVPLGHRLIAEESDLDQAFAGRSITAASLAEKTAAIGQTQGALRAAHLRYHLAQAELLTPEQMHRYAELRGYAGGQGHSGGHHPGMKH
jgi:Spy/CpxP family protein refolding chaperone